MTASDAYVSAIINVSSRPSTAEKPMTTYPSEAVQTALEANLKYLLLSDHRTRIRRPRLPRNKQYLNHEHRDSTICEMFPTKEKSEGLDPSRCVWLCEGEEAGDE